MKLGQGCHKRTPRWYWAMMLLLAAAALPGVAFIAADEDGGQAKGHSATENAEQLAFGAICTGTCPDGGTTVLSGTEYQKAGSVPPIGKRHNTPSLTFVEFQPVM